MFLVNGARGKPLLHKKNPIAHRHSNAYITKTRAYRKVRRGRKGANRCEGEKWEKTIGGKRLSPQTIENMGGGLEEPSGDPRKLEKGAIELLALRGGVESGSQALLGLGIVKKEGNSGGARSEG